MISAGNYGHVILTRTAGWKQVGEGFISNISSIKSIRFSPDDRSNTEFIAVHGQRIAVAGEDAHVRFYRITSI